ncbi:MULTISPECIES: VOC family protein [unclassified Sphingobium]|uniref:VOC family protein n=1 Tax=unclassified Sphingobium TaxID=2611147 RepID=UPI00119C02FC|nr:MULTISPECIES: VOC family protein [unclassified Sphingobium]MBG6120050.1 hypothetical protein [Sphingobium sp. JAI105]TWD05749.1 glyoxalase/bleomycin resistance protein/dioxygenase superfamily protein [Sphingobium sp. AEW010]TWD23302.1 glyoxalase/bleomycin resistance protein/dioxygenase superfamily protein [Sphingobium sp. AEW013]TWD25162.1 glyoxalase/bleomycin resistance protein/dioxygenase superfamily protein [Sphingobium sp. AEW001]
MIGFFTNSFSQVAYVTNRFDEAIARFANDYGVTRWLEVRDMDMGLDADRRLRMDVGFAMAGGVQIELIAPSGGDDAIYRGALSPDCEGLQIVHHHIAQRMATLDDLDALRERARANGLALPINYHSPNGVHYFYVDTRETLGHYLEYVWFPPEYWEVMNARIPVN